MIQLLPIVYSSSPHPHWPVLTLLTNTNFPNLHCWSERFSSRAWGMIWRRRALRSSWRERQRVQESWSKFNYEEKLLRGYIWRGARLSLLRESRRQRSFILAQITLNVRHVFDEQFINFDGRLDEIHESFEMDEMEEYHTVTGCSPKTISSTTNTCHAMIQKLVTGILYVVV